MHITLQGTVPVGFSSLWIIEKKKKKKVDIQMLKIVIYSFITTDSYLSTPAEVFI